MTKEEAASKAREVLKGWGFEQQVIDSMNDDQCLEEIEACSMYPED